jgi:two-component system response regulator MprA
MTKPAETMMRVLLVEDDPAMVALISLGLRYEGYEVITSGNGLDGLRLAQESNPDLLLIDWQLPGLDGVSLCRRVRASSDMPIIMITARDAVDDRIAGLDAGADDYIVKPFDIDELLARVRARLRRIQPIAQASLLTFADLSIDPECYVARRGDAQLSLTATEFKLLIHFLRHPRQVLSKEVLLEEVWGYDFGGDANIVEQYIRSLRQKMGEPGLIQTLRGVGYSLREAGE